MKYDLSKPLTRGAKRTLYAFKDGMFTLLAQKPFEEITVNELCELVNYPRATFYNYFDDKYDLLNFCWNCLGKEIRLNEYEHMVPEESPYIFFDRICDLADANIDRIHKILQNNPETKYMLSSFRNYMYAQVRVTFENCTVAEAHQIPKEILAKHYSNTLLLILEWRYWRETICTREEALQYLRYLVGNLP